MSDYADPRQRFGQSRELKAVRVRRYLLELATKASKEAMKAAPQGAVYVWPPSSARSNGEQLAAEVMRADLRIVHPGWLRYATAGPVVVDPAVRLTRQQREVVAALAAGKDES